MTSVPSSSKQILSQVQGQCENPDTRISGIHYNYKRSDKFSILGGGVIVLGGAGILSVAALILSHMIPLSSPLAYGLLSGGGAVALLGLGILLTDRIIAHKNKSKYINEVNIALQTLLDKVTEGNDNTKFVEDLNRIESVGRNKKYCHLYKGYLGQIEIVFLKDKKDRIQLHVFKNITTTDKDSPTAAKVFFEKVQRPALFSTRPKYSPYKSDSSEEEEVPKVNGEQAKVKSSASDDAKNVSGDKSVLAAED